MTVTTKLAILTALLILPDAATATAQDNTLSHASKNDCAVIAAIALEGAWTNAPMSAKSFGVACDWKALGLPQPAITTEEHPVISFGYSQPVYSADGLQATVNYSYGGDHSVQGHPEQYFYTGSKCTAEKRNGKWQSLGCRMSFIT